MCCDGAAWRPSEQWEHHGPCTARFGTERCVVDEGGGCCAHTGFGGGSAVSCGSGESGLYVYSERVEDWEKGMWCGLRRCWSADSLLVLQHRSSPTTRTKSARWKRSCGKSRGRMPPPPPLPAQRALRRPRKQHRHRHHSSSRASEA